jgi:hypothetical protein
MAIYAAFNSVKIFRTIICDYYTIRLIKNTKKYIKVIYLNDMMTTLKSSILFY